jgi:hypothetical protein
MNEAPRRFDAAFDSFMMKFVSPSQTHRDILYPRAHAPSMMDRIVSDKLQSSRG